VYRCNVDDPTQSRVSICGSTARVVKNTAVRLIAITGICWPETGHPLERKENRSQQHGISVASEMRWLRWLR
jgi:hypothetical protein